MRTVNIGAARARRSRLVDDAAKGEEILIAKAGRPVARLVPLAAACPQRRLGGLAGKIKISEDFDAPLPDDILDAFERRE
jgi:prevent-host-death family protein